MVMGSREETVNVFLSSVDQSSMWTSGKRHCPCCVSFAILLVTSSGLHGAAGAGDGCGRSCLGVESRSSRIQTLGFSSGLFYGNIFFQSYDSDFCQRLTSAKTCWNLHNIIFWQLQHLCHGLSAGWIASFVYKIPCSVSGHKDKLACSLCLSQLSCLSPHGKRFIRHNYV